MKYIYRNKVAHAGLLLLTFVLAAFGGLAQSPLQQCVTSVWSPTNNQNYIRHRVFKVPNVTTANLEISRSTCDVNQTVSYFDGLGRPLQTIDVQASPAFKDMVQPFAYDKIGRESTKYLIYTDAGTAGGTLRANALTAGQGLASFYNSPPAGVKSTAYPFSKYVIESSPKGIILETGAPGQVWQPAATRGTTSGRTVVNAIGNNLSNEVRYWTVSTSGASSTGYYSANTFTKTTIKDENWEWNKAGTIDEFKDLDGRLVLKQVWQDESTSLKTYYIYDVYGNLRYVVPPAVTATSFVESDAVFADFIYGYHYDAKNRVSEKKLPGKGWEYIVYNDLDQIVMSQDARQRNQANQRWIVIKYDSFGREVFKGLFVHSGSSANMNYRASMQSSVNSVVKQWVDRVGTGVGYTVGDTYPSAVDTVLKVDFYDDYSAPSMPYFSSAYSGMTKGLLTASRVNILGTSDYLWTVNYYDNKSQVVKSFKQHYQNGSVSTNHDEVTNNYTFPGELKKSTKLHKANSVTTTIVTRYAFDHLGRKKAVIEKINAGTEFILSKFDYNEIGQLSKKSLHSQDSVNYMQNTRYGYNERGWLKRGISNEFSMKLGYDTLSNPYYNGNIATQEWGTGFTNKFLYTYDKLNRLINGVSSGTVMSEVLNYDAMGNILSLNRDGVGVGTYNYTGTGNKLNYINGGGLTTGTYAYDANGNAYMDGRSGATLGYNMLNLPITATKTGLNLSYKYDASGNKLRKVNSISGVTTHYIDDIEYKGNVIDIIHTEEGVIRNISGSFNYEYTLKDHLGNARYSFDVYAGALRRIQQQDYYPFGKIKETTQYTFGEKNKYLYNSKELQEELGQLDYGARFYDPVIGRFSTIDPLSDEFDQLSPYNYAKNNPILMIDPDGMAADTGKVTPQPKPDSKSDPKPVELKEVVIKSGPMKGWVATGQTGLFAVKYKMPEAVLAANRAEAVAFLGKWTYYGRAITAVTNLLEIAQNMTQANGDRSEKVPDGFKETKEFGKRHGEKVYKKGNKYYSKDADGHNGGAWKVFEKQGTKLKRVGTADKNLKIFKK